MFRLVISEWIFIWFFESTLWFCIFPAHTLIFTLTITKMYLEFRLFFIAHLNSPSLSWLRLKYCFWSWWRGHFYLRFPEESTRLYWILSYVQDTRGTSTFSQVGRKKARRENQSNLAARKEPSYSATESPAKFGQVCLSIIKHIHSSTGCNHSHSPEDNSIWSLQEPRSSCCWGM